MAYRNESTKSMVPCMFCVGFFTTLASIITIFGAIIPLINIYNFEQLQCNVTNVEYPTSLPTADDTNNWIPCDCGRRCTSWSPCIKIYNNYDNSSFMLENIYSNSNIECTYSDSSCPRSEDVIVLQEELRLAIARAESYINETIPCFYNGYTEFYYISNYLDESAVYFYLVITGILLLLMMIMCITYCRVKRKNVDPSINYYSDETYSQTFYTNDDNNNKNNDYQTGYPPSYDNV